MTRYLEDWELDMLMGGDSTPEMQAALVGNPENRARWEQLQKDEKTLFANLFRTECPTSLELGEWSLNLVDASRYQVIRSHLDICSHCEEELAAITAVVSKPLFQGNPAKMGRSILKRIIMKLEDLLGDGLGQMAFAPVAVRGKSWSVCYAGGDYLLSLTKQETRSGGALIGSILANDLTGHATLKQGPSVVYETPLTESATFTFDDVNPGAYELVIATSDAELIVPELHIEP
jgi:hypothetical protein